MVGKFDPDRQGGIFPSTHCLSTGVSKGATSLRGRRLLAISEADLLDEERWDDGGIGGRKGWKSALADIDIGL
ncbi:hypothetical protein [Martelella soudanensis]|uniref:hypothetical protein n=1 Tax=unclassified Martelella TaxID=2629616 RepID=UPI0015DF5244|nr:MULTISPECIES: hypothetical protein [unclassified Martelella]